jgi:hypothetical protein
MSVSDALHAAKSQAMNIINARLANEKADFAFSKVPQESVKQFNVEGVGTINVPISEQVSCM